MSFPHTQQVIDSEDVAAKNLLLRQYFKLCTVLETQANNVPGLHEQLATLRAEHATRVADLEAKIAVLRAERDVARATVENMEAHPDVKAKRVAATRLKLAEVQKELQTLEGSLPNVIP